MHGKYNILSCSHLLRVNIFGAIYANWLGAYPHIITAYNSLLEYGTRLLGILDLDVEVK